MFIKSTYDGLHVITGTTENSPADKTQRIHAGDEVVQVNRQMVVGWQLKHLVEKLRAESGGVVLVVKKRPRGTSCSFMPAPLKNLRWRPALVKGGAGCPAAAGIKGKAAILDLYIPPPPIAPYEPHESGVMVKRRPTSPNSCLDADVARSFAVSQHDNNTPVSPPAACSQPIAVRLRQSSASARSKPRPVSMPVDSCLSVSDLSCRGQRRKGQEVLHRCLSNERISTITEEEEPCFPLPYRGHPLVRGVDHIRGSQCFISADLHSSATIPYQEVASKKSQNTATATAVCPVNKQPSVLSGWLARLRLLTH